MYCSISESEFELNVCKMSAVVRLEDVLSVFSLSFGASSLT